MNAELLLEHFHRLGDAPDAVPRLRRFILDLAVRGKLVEQDGRDESVDVLLARTQKEMQRLVGLKELKSVSPLEEIDPVEIPFEVPQGWRVVRMGWLARKLGAGSTPLGGKTVYQSEGVPFLRSQNVHDDGLRLDDVALIPRAVHERMSGTHIQENDILLNITGASIGRCALVPSGFGEGNVSQHVAIVRLHDPALRGFIHLSLRSPFFQKVIDDVQVGVSREGLSMQGLKKFPMLVPPLPEQHRIVAKVEELMALCDHLEAAQQQREAERTRLTAAAWQAVVQAEAPAEVSFALDQLHALTTRPAQVKALRQTILDLAVRGRLVEQDEKDEPAEVLLERIQAHKAKLVEAGKLRGQVAVVPIVDSEDLEPLPENWQWVRFGDLMVSRDGERIPVSQEERATKAKTYDYYGASGVIDKIDGYLFDKPLLLIGEDGANLINRSTPIAFIARGKYWVNNHAHVIDAINENLLQWVELYINAIDLKPYVTGTAQPKMNQAKMNSIPVAVPPEAEQRRIVAKVEELMALCDGLEAALQAGEALRGKVLEATIRSDDQMIRRSDNGPRPEVVQKPKVRVPRYVEPEPEVELAVAAEPVGSYDAAQVVAKRRPGRPRKSAAAGNGQVEAMIQNYLKAHPGWHGKAAILEATGVDAGAWNAAIKALLKAGKVERQGEKKGARYRGV